MSAADISRKITLSIDIFSNHQPTDSEFVYVHIRAYAKSRRNRGKVDRNFKNFLTTRFGESGISMAPDSLENEATVAIVQVPANKSIEEFIQFLQSLVSEDESSLWMDREVFASGNMRQALGRERIQHAREEAREAVLAEQVGREAAREQLENMIALARQTSGEQREELTDRIREWEEQLARIPRSQSSEPEVSGTVITDIKSINASNESLRQAWNRWQQKLDEAKSPEAADEKKTYKCPITLAEIKFDDNSTPIIVLLGGGKFEVWQDTEQTKEFSKQSRILSIDRTTVEAIQEFASIQAFNEFIQEKFKDKELSERPSF